MKPEDGKRGGALPLLLGISILSALAALAWNLGGSSGGKRRRARRSALRRAVGVLRWSLSWGASIVVLAGLASIVLMFMAPRAFGWEALSVRSGSMEPSISVGSLLLAGPADPAEIRVGDVITYRNQNDPQTRITHRVIEIMEEEGTLAFRTKGDANEVADQSLVRADDVIGVVRTQVPMLGHAAEFLRTKLGFALVIGIPTGLIILSESVKLLRLWRASARSRERGGPV